MPKTSKANKKFTKTVIGATPVDTKNKKTKRGSGDSLDKKKWGLDLVKGINPNATWDDFLTGAPGVFLDKDGQVLKYKNGDVRFNWLQMIDQTEKLLQLNNPFKNDPESRDFLLFLMQEVLHYGEVIENQEPVKDTEDYEVTSKRSDLVVNVLASQTAKIKIALPNAVVFTPYHVHYLVNIVTAYVSKSRTEYIVFQAAGKMTTMLERLHLF